MTDPKRFPSDVYDVILSVLQLIVVGGLMFLPLGPWAKVLAVGLIVVYLAHWTARRGRLWWILVGMGTAIGLSSAVILALHR